MSASVDELKELYKDIFVQLMHVSQLLYEDHENFFFQSENQALTTYVQKIDFWRQERFIREA